MNRDVASELGLLLSMTADERRVLFLLEKVELEGYLLGTMLDGWKYERSYTMGDIREQRKRVQEWTSRLNAAKAKQERSRPNDVPKP